jgi:hypothetical protein
MENLPERIRKKVRMMDNGCIEWTGYTNGVPPYGSIYVRGSFKTGHVRYERVHRFVYREVVGDIPQRMFVCHTCDNPLCVNPDHLWLGTHSENMKDAYRKGRVAPPKQHMFGECNPNSKLTESQVRMIKQRLSEGESSRSISRDFGVNKDTVLSIAHGKTWAE